MLLAQVQQVNAVWSRLRSRVTNLPALLGTVRFPGTRTRHAKSGEVQDKRG